MSDGREQQEPGCLAAAWDLFGGLVVWAAVLAAAVFALVRFVKWAWQWGG